MEVFSLQSQDDQTGVCCTWEEPQTDAPCTHLCASSTLHALTPAPPHSSIPGTGVTRALPNVTTCSPLPFPTTLGTDTSLSSLRYSLVPHGPLARWQSPIQDCPGRKPRETPNSRKRRFSDRRFHCKERPKLNCYPQPEAVSPCTLGNRKLSARETSLSLKHGILNPAPGFSWLCYLPLHLSDSDLSTH